MSVKNPICSFCQKVGPNFPHKPKLNFHKKVFRCQNLWSKNEEAKKRLISRLNKKLKVSKILKSKERHLLKSFSKKQLEKMTCPICVQFLSVLSSDNLSLLHREIIHCFKIKRSIEKKNIESATERIKTKSDFKIKGNIYL